MIKPNIALILLAATLASATTPVQAGALKDRAKLAVRSARIFAKDTIFIARRWKGIVRCNLQGKPPFC